jgi:hypothetical protein
MNKLFDTLGEAAKLTRTVYKKDANGEYETNPDGSYVIES